MNGKATKYPRDDEMTQQEGRWNPDLAGDYDRIAEFDADATRMTWAVRPSIKPC